MAGREEGPRLMGRQCWEGTGLEAAERAVGWSGGREHQVAARREGAGGRWGRMNHL